MAMKQSDNKPPEWVLNLQRRMESRMKSAQQDPFKANTFNTRMAYWMMSSMSLVFLIMLVVQIIYTGNLYMLVALLLGAGLWGWLNYYCHKKRGRRVWFLFPQTFRDYIIQRNKFFEASWHVIFVALSIGGIMLIVHYAGFSGIFTPKDTSTKNSASKTISPEDKAQMEKFRKLLNDH